MAINHLVLPLVATVLVASSPVDDPTQTQKEVEQAILQDYAYLNRNKTTKPDSYSKDGALEFWSNGGLLHEVGPGGRPERYSSVAIEAKHIRVIPLVEGKVAVAHFYSEGSMQPDGYAAVTHFMTRVTQVFVKVGEQW